MGKLIWLGILVGIVLGPCYYLYTRYVSGTVAQETMVYGADLQARKNAWMTPVKVHLEPSMNPIAFDLAISDSPDLQTSNPVNHYTMSLAEGDKILWSFDWALGYTKTRKRGYVPNYSNRLRVFSVSQAGDYSFNVKPESEGGINLREMTLKVKTNVVQRNDAVAGFGFVLMGVFIGIGWLRLKSLDARRR